jgi:hypothetical protein
MTTASGYESLRPVRNYAPGRDDSYPFAATTFAKRRRIRIISPSQTSR